MPPEIRQLSMFDDIAEDITAVNPKPQDNYEEANIEAEPVPMSPLAVPYKPRRRIRDEDYRSTANSVFVDKSNPDP